MALTDEGSGGMYMPVAPAYGGGNGGFGFGGDWAWILLLLVLFGGGWGNGFGGGYGMDGLYPWMNNSQNINGGFRDQMLNTSITSIGDKITSGFGDVQTALCGGFAGVNASIANGFAQSEIAANARQLADLQQSFALQTQLANCCCENRAGIADLKYTLASEGCSTRATSTANTQAILDKLCSLELEAKNDTIAQLRSQVNELSRQASQNAQTAAILANNEAQTTALERYLAPTPIPAYIVQNPACSCNSGCGV